MTDRLTHNGLHDALSRITGEDFLGYASHQSAGRVMVFIGSIENFSETQDNVWYSGYHV